MKKVSNQLKSFHTSDFLWGMIVVVGVILRLRQYFVNRSLWVDEASLALNIINRTFSALTLPLDYDQGAPMGFLFIQKFLVLILGNSEYILRLFPLFSGVLAIYLVYCIAKEYFENFGIFAVLLFSISNVMIYYSSELKQYSTDVMIALLLTNLTLFCLKKGSDVRSIVLLGVTGVLSIFLSHPSAFVLSVAGLLLVLVKTFQKDFLRLRWLFGVGMMWGGAFFIAYILSLSHLIDNVNLQDYWSFAYSPLPPWEHLDWYENVVVSMLPQISPSFLPNIIPNFNQIYLIYGCLLLLFVGGVSLFFRDPKLAFLIVFPFLVTFVASAFHRYPMSDRFLHFWFPSLLLLMAEGLGRMYLILARFSTKVALLVYSLVTLIILWTPLSIAYNNALNPPLGEDIKPVLVYIQEHVQENDFIYVHNGSVTPFLYYSSSYGFDMDDTFVAMKSWNIKRFTVDVEELQGSNRVWFIFSHVVSCDCEGNSRAQRIEAHVQVIDAHGVQMDRFEATNAATYLYDLNP